MPTERDVQFHISDGGVDANDGRTRMLRVRIGRNVNFLIDGWGAENFGKALASAGKRAQQGKAL